MRLLFFLAFVIILSHLKVEIPQTYEWINLGKLSLIAMLVWAVIGDVLSGIKKIQNIDWKK